MATAANEYSPFFIMIVSAPTTDFPTHNKGGNHEVGKRITLSLGRHARSRLGHVRRPEERARLGLPALWAFGAEGQAGTDDNGLARLHRRRARAAANERDARIDPGAPCAPAPDRDRGRA